MALKQQNTLSGEFSIHPGVTINEVIQKRDISKKELAISTGFSQKHISKVINGKMNISALMAEKLEDVLRIPASFWLNLQRNYDLEVLKFNQLHNVKEKHR